MNETIHLLKQHRSIRKFKPTPIDNATLVSLIEAGQHAASSSFFQAVTVIRVRDAEKRRTLARLAGNQTYVATAPVFLVFCADLNRSRNCCSLNDVEMRAGFIEQFIIATVDTALFAQNVVIAAESLGLGICYIGAVRNNPQPISELLELPDQVYPVFGLCLGYPDQDIDVKPRLPHQRVLREETYGDADDTESLANYDELMRNYYESRSGDTKSTNWTRQIAAKVGDQESRPHMLEFLRQRGLATR